MFTFKEKKRKERKNNVSKKYTLNLAHGYSSHREAYFIKFPKNKLDGIGRL